MTFIERLRTHLERLPQPLAEPLVMAPYQAHLFRRLRELEQSDAAAAERLYLEMTEELETFVLRVRTGILQQGLVSPDSAADLDAMTLIALDGRLGLHEEGASRVVAAALRKLWGHPSRPKEPPVDVQRYAFETRLSRRREREMVLARAGRVFLALPGRDAVAWLLALEMAQAQSEEDPFRLSTSAATRILSSGEWFIPYSGSDPEGPPEPPAIYSSLVRLEALGVIQIKYDSYGGVPFAEGHSLTPEGRSVLHDLTREGESRWNPLAAACIAEERGLVLDELLPLALRFQRESAAEAAAREARLVTHEIRNALGPVQFALTRLLALVAETEAQRQLTRVEQGVTRLFRFVEDRLRMADAIDQSGESFMLDNAVRELLSRETPSEETVPELALAAGEAEVRGPRSSVVLALGELIRNAHLANGARVVHVRISTERRNGHVTLLVDDDGAGVPPGDRERIFQRGISLRGGSGEGLAIAKDVFERAIGGTIRCMESPLGGARIEMILPTVPAVPRIPR